MNTVDGGEIADKVSAGAIADFLTSFGINLENQHLKGTPDRVVRAWRDHFLSGYNTSPESVISTEFKTDYDQMIVVKNIHFHSMCAHHLIPFIGKAKVGYVPKDGIITGLSKLVRLVDVFAHRLQIQEDMTHQIANILQSKLSPMGVGVIIEAEHLCMTIRGVQRPGTTTVTSHLIGCMQNEAETRQEFLQF